MAKIIQGQTTETIHGTNCHSIVDIHFSSGLIIYLFPGSLSPNDILVKFRDTRLRRTRSRTPSHIHWATDLLVKKDNDAKLTDDFLNEMLKRWNQINPLTQRNYTSILNELNLSRNPSFIKKHSLLNQHGFFEIEFITFLMEVLMLQEKTNRPDAYMFRNVVQKLIQYSDLYGIITAASYRGR